jgi:hypothetical protein
MSKENTRNSSQQPSRAPPGAPAGPANLQSSKALVEKLKAQKVQVQRDYEVDSEENTMIEDEDYIKHPRIPVPLAEESLADAMRRDDGKDNSDYSTDDDSDEREMNELDSESRSTGFVSHRARKQLANGGNIDAKKTDYEKSPGRQAAVVAPFNLEQDEEKDNKKRVVKQDSVPGESILSVFNVPTFDPPAAVKERDRLFEKSGLSNPNRNGNEVIGRKTASNPNSFSIIAHEHGFMPLSSRRSYKGVMRQGGMQANARNGAADEGEFFETDKVYCTILRDRFTSKMYPEYQLVLDCTQKPLLLAKKMTMNKTSNYHIFDMSRGRLSLKGGSDFDKKSGNYLGKLRASTMGGSDYVLYGNANSSSTSGSDMNNYLPENMQPSDINEDDVRRELGAISYERMNMFSQIKNGSQPRKLSVVLPPLDAYAVPVANTYMTKDKAKHSFEKCLKDPIEASARECYTLESKEPTYENGNYRLNFSGRVSLPSVKNFQLVSAANKSDILCQFGKVGDDTFHLDFKRPVTAFQAFAFALSQFNL